MNHCVRQGLVIRRGFFFAKNDGNQTSIAILYASILQKTAISVTTQNWSRFNFGMIQYQRESLMIINGGACKFLIFLVL